MEIYLDSWGTSLRREGKMFLIDGKEKKERIAVKKVSSFVLGPKTKITTDAIRQSIENDISIYVCDEFGYPIGSFTPAILSKNTRVRKWQSVAASNDIGFKLAKKWIIEKLEASLSHLIEIAKKNILKSSILESIEELKLYILKIQMTSYIEGDKYNKIRGYEGQSAKVYFKVLGELCKGRYPIRGRNFHPALDEFNSVLNYSYGILYRMIEKSAIYSGLDPAIGFFHSMGNGKLPLTYDLIERYRIHILKEVFYLFNTDKFDSSSFEKSRISINLTKEGKKNIADYILSMLRKKRNIENKRQSIEESIKNYCSELSNEILEVEDVYFDL